MIPFISNLFNLPVTRKEVLKRAKRYKGPGLCYTIGKAFEDYNIIVFNISLVLPLFNKNNTKQFGGSLGGYWWDWGVWNTGRMAFLNWLIEQYKDDKTNLRKL